MLNEIERIAQVISEDPSAPPIINESSLGKIYQYAMDYDCAIVSASRGDPSDNSMCVIDSSFAPRATKSSKRQAGSRQTVKYETNAENTALLLDEIRALGYIVIQVRGSYIEGMNSEAAKLVNENSFFVVNNTNDANFNRQMIKLGEQFCQDSVLLSPKGARNAYLYGTNYSSFPKYQQEVGVGRLFLGDPHGEAEFHTRLGQRPFRFKED